MNADAFHHFYGYHFSENRKIWDRYVTQLSYEQFTQPVGYSHGSVRDQIIHLLDVGDVWFSELRGVEPSQRLKITFSTFMTTRSSSFIDRLRQLC